jgi:hypothetical protein
MQLLICCQIGIPLCGVDRAGNYSHLINQGMLSHHIASIVSKGFVVTAATQCMLRKALVLMMAPSWC